MSDQEPKQGKVVETSISREAMQALLDALDDGYYKLYLSWGAPNGPTKDDYRRWKRGSAMYPAIVIDGNARPMPPLLDEGE